VKCDTLTFSGHAIRRMFERHIAADAVVNVIRDGDVIESYPDDRPYPSNLILGWVENKPLHVLFAVNEDSSLGVVVTVYVPYPELWSKDYRTRIEE